jgi:hypothetical protein
MISFAELFTKQPKKHGGDVMERKSNLQHLLKLEDTVKNKTNIIFQRIIEAVERRDNKYLFLMSQSHPLRVNWLVLPLDGYFDIPRIHVFLQLLYQPWLQTWFLGIFWQPEPYDQISLLRLLYALNNPTSEKEIGNNQHECEPNHEVDDGRIFRFEEIDRISLMGGINVDDIAERIVAAGIEIYEGQKLGVQMREEKYNS